MKQLEEKYIDGTLSAQELEQLRTGLQAESDEAIAERMGQHWADDEADPALATPKELATIWERVQQRLLANGHKGRSLQRSVWLWAQRAAILLLPLLLASLLYLYRENRTLASDFMTLATAKGERATVMLPDSTRVYLNEETSLSYSAKSFNGRRRHLTFDGEAWFEVTRDADHPFHIDADRTSVTVTGTKFNLHARRQDETATLALAEGNVVLTHTPTGRHVDMHHGQKATLNKLSGTINVEEMESTREETAWRRKEVVFRNMPIGAVIRAIESNFDVTVQIRGDIGTNDLYTGTMSTTDINVDLEILERLYHVKTRVVGQHVYIYADK